MAEQISAKDFYGGVGDWIDIDPETGEEYIMAEVEVEEEAALLLSQRGGPGSGHFAHEGRPGERGGSQPGDGQDGGPGDFAMAGTEVDGRTVLEDVPNRSSIESSLTNYEILPGIREVPFAAFDPSWSKPPTFYSASERERTEALAASMGESKSIKPLIVVVDAEGPYVLEGGHRFDALRILGAKSFPALIVMDRDSIVERSKPVITPILRRLITKGGPGSGHHGHAGRPGERGGSLPGEVSQQHEPGILGNIIAGDKYKDYIGPSEERLHTAGLRSMAQGRPTSQGIDKPTMAWAFAGMRDIAARWLAYNDYRGKSDKSGRPYLDEGARALEARLAEIGEQASYEGLVALHDAMWAAEQSQTPSVSVGPERARNNLAAPPGTGKRVVKFDAAEVATPGPKGQKVPWLTANHGWHLYNNGRGAETWAAKREWDKEHGTP